MKKPIKLTIIFTAQLLAALFFITLLPGTTACNQPQATTLTPTPIDSDIIVRHMVPLDKALQQQKILISSQNANNDTTKYTGGILRPTDLLLSLGLNDVNLYQYVKCTNIMAKTMLGINNAGNVTLYVHPVLVVEGAPFSDLYFDHVGNLYKYDSTTKTGTPFTTNCTYTGVGAATPGKSAKDTLPASSLYVIDLNNPCPPCL